MTAAPDAHASSRGVRFVPGDKVGHRYTITKLLGAGGMGAVYQAWDDVLGVPVALKTILPELEPDPFIAHQREERFRKELLLARRITHENVVRIHDIGEYRGIKFITMPLIDGVDLRRLLRQHGALPIRRVVALARQIAAALAAAHKAGVVHRDLKPANIMIDGSDRALLMDFGIAHSRDTAGATGQAVIVGTIEYMSPEQAGGLPIDERSDVYSFGLILYEMLLGLRQINPGAAMSDLMARMTHAPPSPRSSNALIPPALSDLVKRCLEPDPAARFTSGEALADALTKIDDDGRAIFGRRYATRLRAAALATAAALAAAIVAGGILLWSRTTASRQAGAAPRDPVSVLIADFANRTGDAVFDGSIEHALSLSVEGASFIAAYPRREALRLASQIRPGGALDEQVAQLVARREGVKYVLAGAIASAPRGFALSVRALDGATGGQITAASFEARGKDAVLGGVARCAVAVRRALGDATPEGEQLAAAETFTAGSLEAAHAYVRAQDLFWSGRQQDSIEWYKKAIELDSALGRAYAGLAATYNNSGNREEAARYYELTMKHLDRMSDREKLRTLSAYYLFVRNPDRAIEELDTLVRRYPADSGGLTNLALAKFYRRDMTAALDVSRRAIRVYPENVVMRNNMALYAMYAGDFDTARAEAQEVVRRSPTYAKAWLAQAIVAALDGQLQAAADFYDRLAAVNASSAALGRADLAMLSGQPARAATLLQQALGADYEAHNQTAAARKLTALGEAAVGLAQRGVAAEALKEALARSRSDAVLTESARVYIALGRYPEAEALARQLGDSLEADPRAYSKVIQGEVLLARKDFRNALRYFREARTISDVWLGRVLAGRAHFELGEYTEAYAELDTALGRHGEAAALFLDDVPTTRNVPPLYYWRGRAQEGLGSPAATESYRRFLAFGSGDTADPLVADARRRVGGG